MKMNGKIYKVGFFVLLIINIALVSFVALKRQGSFMKRDMRERLSNQLGLDESQKKAFMDMAKLHREKIREIDNQERALLETYFDFLIKPDSLNSKNEILQQIQVLKKAKVLATYKHFEELKEICSDEQQAEFEAFMKRVIPMISGGQRRGNKKPPR